MANIGGGRALRVCDLCGIVDDHPRHVLAGGDPGSFARPGDDVLAKALATAPEDQRVRLVNELLDTGTSDRHLDCCRAAGCPDGSCTARTVGAEDQRGADLLAHLMKGA